MDGSTAVISFNTVVNILLGSSLKLLWGMINTFQFVVFFSEWKKAQQPPNVVIVIQALRSIALGEFIPSHWLTDPIKEMLDIYGEDGEEKKENILSSMGAILIVLLFMTLAIIITLFLWKSCKRNPKA